MLLELKERMIAYFDILGYRNAFMKKGFDSHKYLTVIQNAMRTTSEHLCDIFAPINLYVKVFSDNVVIVSDSAREVSALPLKLLLSELQQTLMCEYGILIRGGVTYGEIYMDDTLVFGQGLIDAVELEGKANYPRIIVDETLTELFSEDGYICAEVGIDGRMEIIYLRTDAGDDEALDGYLRDAIVRLALENCAPADGDDAKVASGKEALIKKYLWLIDMYNLYHPTDAIDYFIASDLQGYLYLQVVERRTEL